MPNETEREKRLAVETILDSEGLTDDLKDVAARRLLAWGVVRAEQLAARAAGRDLDRAVGNLRRLIKRVNNLVADRPALSGDEFDAELTALIAAASELDGHRLQSRAEVGSLLAERDRLDDAALVERITALLTPTSRTGDLESSRTEGNERT